jgi:hypothetical protein
MPTKPKELSWTEWYAWAKCAVPACQNKCCLSLRSKYCWPHTPGTSQDARDNLLETEPQTAAALEDKK